MKRLPDGKFAVIYPKDEVWPKIIEKIASGRSLADALREPGMPSYASAKLILRENPELRQLYEQAKKDRSDALADELMDLADAPMPEHLQGAERGAWVQHRRLQIDVRKWIAARLHAAAWGDRMDVSVTNTQISITAALEAANARLKTIDMDEI